MNTRRSMHASKSGCRGFACAFAWRPTHATGCARQPFVACECMCFPRRGIDASPTIVMVVGRFGLFAMGCGEGRRSEEVRVGNEGVCTCRFRWSQFHKKKKK